MEGFAPSEAGESFDKLRTNGGIELQGKLSKSHPRLVVTSVTPFGQDGPYRDFQATDIITCAMSGLMYHSGDSDREPLRNALDQSLYVAGANAAAATLVAVFARMASGEGQQVDVSVAECFAAHLVQPVPYYNYMGATKGRRPVRGSGFEELMPARDGYVVPSVQGSQPWETVADLIGLEELHDPRFASGAGRIANGEELKALLIEGLAQWDRLPLFIASGERRLVFGMAQDAGDLVACPHLEARGFFREVEHPVAGRAAYAGMGARLLEGGRAGSGRALGGCAEACAAAGTAQRRGIRRRVGVQRRRAGGAAVRGGDMTTSVRGGPPLENIRVVDLSRVFAMPFAGANLADLGAEVIKIDTCQAQFMETTRTITGPFPDNQPGELWWEQGGTFQTLNRGKRSLTLDLRSEEAQRIVKELVSVSDIVLENFTPRVMARFGLDYASLRAVKPDLIMVSNTGYGHSGPWSNFGAMASALEPTHGTGAYMGYLEDDGSGGCGTRACPTRWGTRTRISWRRGRRWCR